MTGQGWVTGSDIRTRPPTKEYRDGWERIFGKKQKQPDKERDESNEENMKLAHTDGRFS